MKHSHSTRKVCPVCKGTLYKPVLGHPTKLRKRTRFCSRACVGKYMSKSKSARKVQFKQGHYPVVPFKKGNKMGKLNFSGSKFTSENHSFEKHWAWKGDKVGYTSLRKWVYRKRGKADHCEVCGCTEIPKDRTRWFDWANLSHLYTRDLEDWMMMCKPCHRSYDKK